MTLHAAAWDIGKQKARITPYRLSCAPARGAKYYTHTILWSISNVRSVSNFLNKSKELAPLPVAVLSCGFMSENGPSRIAKEAGGIWLASIGICAVLGLLATFIPLIHENILALVAATFLYLPAWQLWRNKCELTDYGLKFQPIAKGLLLCATVTLIVMPLFSVGHHFYQEWFFDQTPSADNERIVRFSQDLDDRPSLPITEHALTVWQESNRLMIMWTGEGPVNVTVNVVVPKGTDPYRELRGFRQTTDRFRLVVDGLAGARASHKGQLKWTRGNAGGIGFSLHKVESFELKTDAEVLRVGRYRMSASSPIQETRTSWWWFTMLFAQIILVAIPEEWFYRGYLQQRFEEAWGQKWQILGVRLGWGWIASSALFALGHLVLDPRPERLAVFFP
ncbi:MAG TPA: CPBP family intramembrane metalloprotease, partial [Myxococcales bacterium]|nr:CPBP family intramembrane metalloprotease [Myxococcales bacterium]